MKKLFQILFITFFLLVGTIGVAFATAPLAVVPEPATAFLFGLGLLGLAGMSRRKK